MGGQGLKVSRTQGFAVALDLDRDAIAVNRHEVDRQVLESVGFGVQLDDGAAPALDGPTDITSPSYGYPMVNGRETLDLTPFAGPRGNVVEWRISDSLVPYPEAVAAMEARAIAIAAQEAGELVWLLEHPPLYTSGTSGRARDLLEARFPLFAAGRGGQITYHGPGQRVAYVMLDLKRRQPDVRAYVASLEEWIIRTLAAFNVRGERREDRVGVWVRRPDKGPGFEDKIAAIGVRLRRWVSFHGIALNVEPDLTHFSAIVPCGVADPRYGVTSLIDLGRPVTMADVDIALRQAFEEIFGSTEVRRREATASL